VPELPDVEGFRRTLQRHAAGRAVRSVEVADRPLLRNTTPQALGRAIAGRRLSRPDRHGKWIVAPVGDVALLFHFGMTGLLDWAEPGAERHRHDRLVLLFAAGELRYRNMRRFGGVWLAHDEDERREVTGPLGPDAQDVGRDELERMLTKRRGGVKAALMDQHLIAGLGNLLADEILWRARVHPRASARTLTRPKRDAIYEALRETLRGSIRRGRVPPVRGWLTGVRDERDPRCPRCGARLRKGTVAGRTACWCPRCQRLRSAT
jgi:formamidopyrimidine-DNA glycosylase